jgi:D-3-phosphoglycerate dehydrogenase
MNPPVVLVTQPTIADEAKKLLAAVDARVSYLHQPPVTPEELCEIVSREGTTAIILRGSPPITREVIEAGKHLRIISKHGAGSDSVDLEAANERGIPVVVAAGTNADAVAEHALGMMLALARDLTFHDRNLRNGVWDKTSYLGREFRSRVIGIVGYGAIGRRVATLCQAFGCKVVAHSRTRPADLGDVEWEDDLDQLFRRADILSLHCPLSDKTRGMVNARSLALMKPDAILINTGRGKLVDEAALHTALTTGKLKAAGLETWAQEPVDPKNPLLQLPNVMSSPHIAPNTRETLVRLGIVSVTQALDYLRDGTLIEANMVNRPVRK